ncbi:iron-containing alcohol dehydrogenase [Bosea minatitlanensis]|uniref:Iron-containing alcohol dehydrogenase n=1 Tax=Bosea minatitlanensis TaxID=128782 RepID=A0ABW0F4K6_9HYPH|nr:iron-containing alcohol dehydrogenase [Bosea minatitlanensis]MCT4494700.1 iron-containing alcohol dehydrogenase [Bosea minatitlanensis]
MALISYLTNVKFGHGEVAGLEADLAGLGIRKPLIIADKGVIAAGLVAAVTKAAAALAGAPVFDGTPTNPTEAAVNAALAVYRAQGCDGLIAIGGGSPIDLAKGVALLATHSGPLADYAAILGGLPKITAAVAPVIAIPTTAGTGSEVGRAALITLDDGRKLGFISPHLIPRLAICDPDLTLGMPSWLTAATGMDAITHCIETYLSPRENPPAEAIALDGLVRAVAHIERAVADGGDRAARKEMLMAALQGGLTFQKGLGAVHALSHPLGGLKQVSLHHGTLNAVLLPAVLRFNAPSAEAKYARIRRALGLDETADLAAWVAALVARLGMPGSLSAMGVPRDVLPSIAEAAVLDHSSATNPRPATADDYARMLEESFA